MASFGSLLSKGTMDSVRLVLFNTSSSAASSTLSGGQSIQTMELRRGAS